MLPDHLGLGRNSITAIHNNQDINAFDGVCIKGNAQCLGNFEVAPTITNQPLTNCDHFRIGSGNTGGTAFIYEGTPNAPSSATDWGDTGEIRWDADYIYLCFATNQWKRAALGTWPVAAAGCR